MPDDGVQYWFDSDFPLVNMLPLDNFHDSKGIYAKGFSQQNYFANEIILQISKLKIFNQTHATKIPNYCLNSKKIYCFNPYEKMDLSRLGDLGGPLMYEAETLKPFGKTRTVIMGVMIHVNKNTIRFGQTNIGVALDVKHYQKWIDFILNDHPTNLPSNNHNRTAMCCDLL